MTFSDPAAGVLQDLVRRTLPPRFYTVQDREDAMQEAVVALLLVGEVVAANDPGREEIAREAIEATRRERDRLRRKVCRRRTTALQRLAVKFGHLSPLDSVHTTHPPCDALLDRLDEQAARDRVGAVRYLVTLALSAPSLLTESDRTAALETARDSGSLQRDFDEARAALRDLLVDQAERVAEDPARKHFPNFVFRMGLLFRSRGSLTPEDHSAEERTRCRNWLYQQRSRGTRALRRLAA
jgi:hypothetical protein